MAAVGIIADVDDVVYSRAAGDIRSGLVTVHLVAQVTAHGQSNFKKVWASHPLRRPETIALPGVGTEACGEAMTVEVSRLPFGGAGYRAGALVRGVDLVANRLNEERLTLVQQELVKPVVLATCDKLRAFETDRAAAKRRSA